MSQKIKEAGYDNEISPLIKEIIKLCKKYKINAFFTFALDQRDDGKILKCTSSLYGLDPNDHEGLELIKKLNHAAYGENPNITAITILTDKNLNKDNN